MAINPDKDDLVWTAGTSETINWIINVGKSATLTSVGGNLKPRVSFFDGKGNLVSATDAAGDT